ncbi:MAG: septum formation protein [Flavobacteriaceae bacterium]|jgi:septum formation protein
MDNITLILGSKSPRRQSLIKELGFPVEVRLSEVEEIYPDALDPKSVPEFLARLKARPHLSALNANEVLITSDTIVLLDDEVIGKPKSEEEARKMLQKLSGRVHEVITGVCLTALSKEHTFSTVTQVSFSELSDTDIAHYVATYSPMDKAGSYAIQEWIGFFGISKINGCYYNVMGLPLHDLRKELLAHF